MVPPRCGRAWPIYTGSSFGGARIRQAAGNCDASKRILEPQTNTDERGCIEVNAANLPDQATIAIRQSRPRDRRVWRQRISPQGSEHLRSSVFIRGFKPLFSALDGRMECRRVRPMGGRQEYFV